MTSIILCLTNIIYHIVLINLFLNLALVVVTGVAGYALAPGIFSPLTFMGMTSGICLTSAAANAINQVCT